MGTFTFEIPDNLFSQLKKCGEMDVIAPKMLKKAAPIIEKAMKTEAAKHSQTGEMHDSIKAGSVAQTKSGDGYRVFIAPHGKNKNGYSRAEILMHLEYGYQRKLAEGGTVFINPTPIVAPAVEASREAVTVAMQEVFDEEIKK